MKLKDRELKVYRVYLQPGVDDDLIEHLDKLAKSHRVSSVIKQALYKALYERKTKS